MGGLAGLFGGASGSTKGAGYALENVAGSDVLPLAGSLQTQAQPIYQQYLDWLQQITSPDPTQRTAAAGPQIATINAQAKGAKKQVAQLPRGGEADYLNAQIDENAATAIGNAINTEYTKGMEQLGLAGQWGIGTALQGDISAGNLFSNAGNIFAGIGAQQAAGAASTEQTIAELAMALAAA